MDVQVGDISFRNKAVGYSYAPKAIKNQITMKNNLNFLFMFFIF